MELDVISFAELIDATNLMAQQKIEQALLRKGIVGIKDVPDFENKCRNFINVARNFSALPEPIKQQYAPHRDEGDTQGYELGAEWFKDANGSWKIDDKKASYYAFVPNHAANKWPQEIDLASVYLTLGELIFATGKLVLNTLGLDNRIGLNHDLLTGYGRMLHYHKMNDASMENPDWCGAHFDHGVFTGLIPAYYFRDGMEIDEPAEAGLFILPTEKSTFEKINADDKSILLFQVGEAGQLISNDRIRATKHMVKKAKGGIERFTFALFYSADDNFIIDSQSVLTADSRYAQNQSTDGKISYQKWQEASFARYRVVNTVVT